MRLTGRPAPDRQEGPRRLCSQRCAPREKVWTRATCARKSSSVVGRYRPLLPTTKNKRPCRTSIEMKKSIRSRAKRHVQGDEAEVGLRGTKKTTAEGGLFCFCADRVTSSSRPSARLPSSLRLGRGAVRLGDDQFLDVVVDVRGTIFFCTSSSLPLYGRPFTIALARTSPCLSAWQLLLGSRVVSITRLFAGR